MSMVLLGKPSPHEMPDGEWFTTHSINVRKGICSCDLTKDVGIMHIGV